MTNTNVIRLDRNGHIIRGLQKMRLAMRPLSKRVKHYASEIPLQ